MRLRARWSLRATPTTRSPDLLGPAGPRAPWAATRPRPGCARTGGGSPLETLTRLLLLQVPVVAHRRRAGAARPGRPAGRRRVSWSVSVGEVAARLDVRPYAAPTPPGPRLLGGLRPDARPGRQRRAGRRRPRARDQPGVDLAGPADRARPGRVARSTSAPAAASRPCTWPTTPTDVVATDVNQRALWMARFNAALNERLPGSTCARAPSSSRWPGERFDLIVTNPPFVISPATGERLVYRDSGLPGDEVVEHIVRRRPGPPDRRRLVPGAGQLGDRPRTGRGTTGSPAGSTAALRRLVVQREVARPRGVRRAVAQGLRPARRRRLHPALRHLAVLVRGPGRRGDRLRLDQPAAGRRRPRPPSWTGPSTSSSRSRRRRCAEPRPSDRARRPRGPARRPHPLVVRDDVSQETVGRPGAEDPGRSCCASSAGFRRARPVDTVEAALVGACDGDLTVGQILDALAVLLERDRAELPRDVPPRRRRAGR